jgi:hypothetical protein
MPSRERASSCRLDPSASRPSRRRVLVQGAAGAAAALTGVVAAGRTSAAAKVPKTQAGYKDTPHGVVRCDRCLQFQPPSGCKIVDGAISPAGSCDFFAPRPG